MNDNNLNYNTSKYHLFWDQNINEKDYLKRIEVLCNNKNHLSDKELLELITFFGRCYRILSWHRVLQIFDKDCIKYLMVNHNERMRLSIIPVLRSEYDRTRKLFLRIPLSVSRCSIEPSQWKKRPLLPNRRNCTFSLLLQNFF